MGGSNTTWGGSSIYRICRNQRVANHVRGAGGCEDGETCVGAAVGRWGGLAVAMVIVFDALPYPEQALTDSQHSAVGRYLLVEDWELAQERAELLIAACRSAENAGDELDTSTESDTARPSLARHCWHSAAPADLATTFDDWFDYRPDELFQSLNALHRMLRDYYGTLIDEEKLAGHLLITHRLSPSDILGEDDEQRTTTHVHLHAHTTRH